MLVHMWWVITDTQLAMYADTDGLGIILTAGTGGAVYCTFLATYSTTSPQLALLPTTFLSSMRAGQPTLSSGW